MPAIHLPQYIEAETSRKCNRHCVWCPVGHSALKRTQELMVWEMFVKLVTELAGLGFKGWFATHNYNEPLLNPRLDQELALLRELLPDARPALYTNGDVLKLARFEELLALGVKYLRVTRYPQTSDVLPTEEAIRHYLRLAGIQGWCDWTFTAVRQGLAAVYEDASTGLKIEIICPDVSTYNDRGGSARVPLIPQARTAPCLMTATSASIDWRGYMKMCCNVAPGMGDGHEQYIVGNLATATFEELWMSAQMQAWRVLHAVSDWSKSEACIGCTQQLPETRRA